MKTLRFYHLLLQPSLCYITKICKPQEVFVWFDSYVPSTIFQLYRHGSSWVEPLLSKDTRVLLKDLNAVTQVRLEPAAILSPVKHSSTEPLRFQTTSALFILMHDIISLWDLTSYAIFNDGSIYSPTFMVILQKLLYLFWDPEHA